MYVNGMSFVSYEDLIVEKTDAILLLKLNRPNVLNALNFRLVGHIAETMRAADKDDGVKVIVLSGNGKAFSAGADVADMSGKSFVSFEHEDDFSVWDDMLRCRKPVIAAVEGYALGGGCELAMSCDIIVSSEGAKFGQPEINLGIIPGAGGTQRLTRAIGRYSAMRYILTGELFTAQDAQKMGLISSLVPDGKALEEAIRIAKVISQKSLIPIMLAKEAVNASQEQGLQQGLRYERQLFYALFYTEDRKEGMEAFLKKRKASFSDR